MNAPSVITALAALLLAGACATAGSGGMQANRHVVFEGERFGYFYYESGGFSLQDNWRPAEAVITIVMREGRALTEEDRPVAARLARHLCEQDGREFNTQSRGHVLGRGGISFAGDCREW